MRPRRLYAVSGRWRHVRPGNRSPGPPGDRRRGAGCVRVYVWWCGGVMILRRALPLAAHASNRCAPRHNALRDFELS